MSNDTAPPVSLTDRRRLLALLIAAGAAGCSRETESGDEAALLNAGPGNSLLWAVAWKQTAAEFFALCHQAYNIARLRLDMALSARGEENRPLAVITDMDDTILHAGSYWGHLINENRDFFSDEIWDEWLPNNLVTAVPGALDFFEYCTSQDVAVFYVTSRDQGERTFEYALAQLRQLQFPGASEDRLYVFRDTSNKTSAREEIATAHDIALMIGDNLNDYRRDYYVTGVDERLALMERDRDHWGRDFILLPNPTDGHWVRAIFGDSEPEPTAENRRRLKEAATRLAWGDER